MRSGVQGDSSFLIARIVCSITEFYEQLVNESGFLCGIKGGRDWGCEKGGLRVCEK